MTTTPLPIVEFEEVSKPRKKARKRFVSDSNETHDDNTHWHVNRSIPVAFIITMILYAVVQSCTVAWFFARQDSRIEVLEKAQALTAPQADRLTRVEEKISNIQSGISDIKVTLAAQEARTNKR